MSIPAANEERHLEMNAVESTTIVVRLRYLMLHDVFSDAHWYPGISTHLDCPFSCKFPTPPFRFSKALITNEMPESTLATHPVFPLKCSGLMQFISTFVQTLGRFYH